MIDLKCHYPVWYSTINVQDVSIHNLISIIRCSVFVWTLEELLVILSNITV